MTADDERYLLAAFGVARRSRAHGNHPFGAVLVAPEIARILEAENTVVTTSDCTAHAELNLIRAASTSLSPAARRLATVYTSAEPCPMCAGAIYWADVRRVVFGLSQHDLRVITGEDRRELAVPMPCRAVFAHGDHEVEVVGPSLIEQAAAVHRGFWNAS